MFRYLSTHPHIFMSDPKEPHYFNTDYANRFVTGYDEYTRLFDAAGEHHAYVGEGSTRYLHSQDALRNILEFNPAAKFLVMIRNPVEMAPALHSQAVFDGYESEFDFEKAWRLQFRRENGLSVPGICLEPKILLYGSTCLMGQQLRKVLGAVNRSNVCIVLYDDFSVDTGRSYRQVLKYLGLPDDGKEVFQAVNRNRVYRSKVLHGFLNSGRRIKRKLGIDRDLGIMRLINGCNVRGGAREPVGPQLRDEMVAYFRDDIALLSGLIDRDLSHWLGVQEADSNEK